MYDFKSNAWTEGPNLPVPFGHGITCTLNFYHGDFSIIGQIFSQVYASQIVVSESNIIITKASSLSGNIEINVLHCGNLEKKNISAKANSLEINIISKLLSFQIKMMM